MEDYTIKPDRIYLYKIVFFCTVMPILAWDCGKELVSAKLQCAQFQCQIVDSNRLGCSSSMTTFDVREVSDVRTLVTTPMGRGKLRGHELRSQHTIYVVVERDGESTEIQVSRALPEEEAHKVLVMLERVRSRL